MADISGRLQQVIDLVREVGDNVVMPHFLKVVRQQKDDGSVFTEADLAAQTALELGLKAIIDCPLIGEEMTPAQQQKSWDAGTGGLWCVDPIDGSSNFVSGLREFAIAAAYMQHGRPLLAVAYAPATHELFYAEAGRGGYLNSHTVNTNKLPLLNGTISLKQAIAEIDFKRLPKNLALELAANPPFHSQRNFGSSVLDWCYLAAGRFDVYLHGSQKLWDYAAACLILQEAGGYMCTLTSEDFWSGDPWNKSVIAARDAALFSEWSAWLARQD